MAGFSPIKVGGWAFGEILTSTQMNQLNTDFPFAVDGRDGGTYTPTDTVSITTPTTKSIELNRLSIGASVDGGGAVLHGVNGLSVDNDVLAGGSLSVSKNANIGRFATVFEYVRTGMRTVAGDTSTGVHVYGPDLYQHVYTDVNPAASCVWRIGAASTVGQEWMRFVNIAASGNVVIQDPTGATLYTLVFVSSFTYAVTVVNMSGTWTVVDRTMKP